MAMGMLAGLGGGGVIGSATVNLLLNSSQFNKGLATAEAQTKKAGTGMSKFGTMAKAGMLAAAAAAVKFGIDSLKAFREAQMVMATTEATIKSTGGAANVTAGHVANLSQQMMEYAVVDDEVIQQGQNLLLTFKAVRNEAGAGNQVFDDASRLMLDLALAMNKGSRAGLDMKSTALQLGKALANPAEGLGKLVRSGVDFTDQQREQIIAMAEAGDQLGAQKAILAEVRAQVGGLARETAASVSPAARLALQWEELQEKAGALIAEGIGPLMENLGKLIGVLEQVGGIIGKVGGEIDKISLRTFASEISGAAAIVPTLTEALAEAVRTGRMSVEELTEYVSRLNPQLEGVDKAGQLSVKAILSLADGSEVASASAGKHAAAEMARAEQMEKAANAAREEHIALLSLAGGFLGIQGAVLGAQDSQRSYAESLAEVNRLTQQGKKGTTEWRDAVQALRQAELAAIEGQLGLAQAIAEYIGQVGEGKAEQAAAIAQIRQFGQAAGLSGGDIRALINNVLELINAYQRIPKTVKTTVTTHYERTGTPTGSGGHAAQHGFHGYVHSPTMILAGEKGTERVDISPHVGSPKAIAAMGKAGGGGAGSVTVRFGNVAIYNDTDLEELAGMVAGVVEETVWRGSR